MKSYTDMNILVTGANGQLGHEMQRVALSGNNNYIFTDVAELDITDYDAVVSFMRREKISLVVNCAAYTNVDKAEDDEDNAYRINASAVENLARACKNFNACLIHVSTDYVLMAMPTSLIPRRMSPILPVPMAVQNLLANRKLLIPTVIILSCVLHGFILNGVIISSKPC